MTVATEDYCAPPRRPSNWVEPAWTLHEVHWAASILVDIPTIVVRVSGLRDNRDLAKRRYA
jgi:hypothetical protein